MALLAIGIFLLSYQWGGQWQRRHTTAVAEISGILLRPPIPLADGGADQEPAAVAAIWPDGRWVLLGFADNDDASGLNGKPVVARMVEIFNRLADQPRLRERLRLILIDPALDPTRATDDARLLPQLALLSESDARRAGLSALATDLGLYLIDPERALRAIFPAALTPAQVAEDIRQLAQSAAAAES